ncbi:hypothetical protein AMTRI_Chr04g245290 [Amborella trichopoda]
MKERRISCLFNMLSSLLMAATLEFPSGSNKGQSGSFPFLYLRYRVAFRGDKVGSYWGFRVPLCHLSPSPSLSKFSCACPLA